MFVKNLNLAKLPPREATVIISFNGLSPTWSTARSLVKQLPVNEANELVDEINKLLEKYFPIDTDFEDCDFDAEDFEE